MPSPLDPFRMPLRLVDDVGRIAEALVELPRITRLMGELRDEVRGMRSDLADVPGHIRSLDDAMSTLPDQVERLRGDIGDLGEEITGMRSDLSSMPAEVRGMRTLLESTRDGIKPLDEDMASVERAVQELPPKLDELREQLDGMRTDLSGLPFVSKS